MASWGRVVAGVVIGVAGTVYATNEDVRKHFPKRHATSPITSVAATIGRLGGP